MPRRNAPRRARDAAASMSRPQVVEGYGWARPESGPDGEWVVRSVPAILAVKKYRCPGCDHEIGPGTAHIVAWPAGELGSCADRRHWHTGCWSARAHRKPTRRR